MNRGEAREKVLVRGKGVKEELLRLGRLFLVVFYTVSSGPGS